MDLELRHGAQGRAHMGPERPHHGEVEAAAEKQAIDIVLLDINMAGTDGIKTDESLINGEDIVEIDDNNDLNHDIKPKKIGGKK